MKRLRKVPAFDDLHVNTLPPSQMDTTVEVDTSDDEKSDAQPIEITPITSPPRRRRAAGDFASGPNQPNTDPPPREASAHHSGL